MSTSFVECRVVPTGLVDDNAKPYYDLLRATFNLVADPRDVRGPINIVVPEHLESIVRESIRFMTACEAHTMGRTKDLKTGMPLVRLVADGYRAGPAGDR